MMEAWKLWLIAAVVFVILEIIPPPTHFFFICTALGSLAAALVALAGGPAWLAWTVFGVASVALTPLMIPLARFLFGNKTHPSNVDELLGEKALVIEPVRPDAPGAVKVRGEVWRAMATEAFAKDETVQVERVDGTHLHIRRIS